MTCDDELTRKVVATPLWGVFTARTRLLKRRTAPWLQRISAFNRSKQRARSRGFTLAELLVSVGVLVLLVFMASQLLNSAATVTTLGYKKMDADSQARQVLDRMGFDFAQMVKRPLGGVGGVAGVGDVDYYLKSSATAPLRSVLQPGNDQIAFYSAVPGYYPLAGYITQNPFSLVAYRVNSDSTNATYNKLERMAKGLVWNGFMPTPTPSGTPPTPLVFMPRALASPIPPAELILPNPTPTATPSPAWPETAIGTPTPYPWSGSEVMGSQVFRFEYYYLLTNGTLSDIPFWNTAPDTPVPGHNGVYGMQDVAAIIVVIAVIDPRSKVLLDTVDPTGAKLARLNGADGGLPVLIDWGETGSPYCSPSCPSQQQWQTTPGLLTAQWRAALDANTIGLPPQLISGVRVYERYFYLTH